MKNLSNLRAIDALDTFAERRTEARKLATPIIEGWKGFGLTPSLRNSPLVAAKKMKPTYSALRDHMSLETLMAICGGVIESGPVIMALEDEKNAFKRSDGSIEVGRPVWFDDKARDTMLEEIRSRETYITLTLSQAITLIDNIVLKGDYPLTIIAEAIKADVSAKFRVEANVVDGAINAIRLRGEEPSPLVQAPSLQAYARDITEWIDGKPTDEAPPTSTLVMPDKDATKLIDMTLGSAGMPPLSKLIDQINAATAKADEWEAKAKTSAMPAIIVGEEVSVGKEIPSGKIVVRKAYEVFGLTSSAAKALLDFNVPTWVWDGVHPHVPDVDPNYIFRPYELFRVLYAIITNQRCYLHGHTGTGKTTLIEQVAALLLWPCMRINFDSEITRMDLIGRDVLSSEGGATVSNFVDGILPQAMMGPYITICDEIDFVRPDVAYVMQRAFEGNGLMLTEDGGRIVKPHKMFRLFATGNTVGQGDEHGMYQGARPQSMAMLDRFTVWIKVDYMSKGDRMKLLKSTAPSLENAELEKINQYVGEHLEAFTTAKVLQPISPRTYMAFASAVSMFKSMSVPEPVDQALATTILDRASVQDRAVLNGLSNRVFK